MFDVPDENRAGQARLVTGSGELESPHAARPASEPAARDVPHQLVEPPLQSHPAPGRRPGSHSGSSLRWMLAAACGAVGPSASYAARMPVEISDAEFDEIVAQAIDQVPKELARFMENVAIITERRATPAQQQGHRGTLLGVYQGVALTKRGPLSYRNVMPDKITIFKEPHCRLANNREQLRDRVTQTVIHEIGHHFGISDRRLRELGW